MLNKIEIERKYPWVRFCSWDGEMISDANIFIHSFPKGWYKAFGELFLEDLNKVITDECLIDTFAFEDIKEKYGSLRVYTNISNKRVNEVIDTYSAISQNVCVMCGKIDVPMLDKLPWISPYCEECYEKHINKYNMRLPYEVMFSDNGIMANSYSYIRFSKEGSKKYTIDISDTVKKVRKYNKEK